MKKPLEMRSCAAIDRLARMASARNSACCLRSSGTRPMPCAMASRGERDTRPACPRSSTLPESKRSAPKMARAVSVRPAPTSPAIAEDFALAHIERHAMQLDGARHRCSCAGAGCPSPRAPLPPIAKLSRAGGEEAELAADHQADDAFDVRLRDPAAADKTAVAQHRVAVADLEDFLEPVGDEDRRYAFAL